MPPRTVVIRQTIEIQDAQPEAEPWIFVRQLSEAQVVELWYRLYCNLERRWSLRSAWHYEGEYLKALKAHEEAVWRSLRGGSRPEIEKRVKALELKESNRRIAEWKRQVAIGATPARPWRP